MKTVLGISGSLRRASFNAGLLRAAADAMPEGARLVTGSIAGIPLYDADLEAEAGTPEAVVALRRALAEADGLLLATPEYNNSIPGVFKNAVDWVASGPSAELFRGKPVAVIGASPMAHGTMLAQDAWWPVLRALGTRPWFDGRLMLGRARGLFDDDGTLTDEASLEAVDTFVKGFVASL